MQPNFIVVGAAKSGTTWLHKCLEEHPEVFVPRNKELHFFSYPQHYQKGIEWYESFFRNRKDEKAVGEISPSYMPNAEVPSRIYAYNPNIRLIFILRNPIERAYSHYCMAMRAGKVSQDINSGLSLDCPYVTWGLYHSQISRFMSLFPLEQIKIYLFDDLKKNPEFLLQDLYTFLEVDCYFKPSCMLTPQNAKKSIPKFPKLTNYLREVYRKFQLVPISGELLTKLKTKGYFKLFDRLNHGAEFPKLPIEKGKSLAEFYQPDVVALSNIVNRDLSFWLDPYLN